MYDPVRNNVTIAGVTSGLTTTLGSALAQSSATLSLASNIHGPLVVQPPSSRLAMRL